MLHISVESNKSERSISEILILNISILRKNHDSDLSASENSRLSKKKKYIYIIYNREPSNFLHLNCVTECPS